MNTTEPALRAILAGFADANRAFDQIAKGIQDLLQRDEAHRSGKTGAEYRSPLQSAIMAAIQAAPAGTLTAPLDAFVDDVVARLPAPSEGRRDARRQSVKRAIEGFSKKAEAPLALKGDLVVFYV